MKYVECINQALKKKVLEPERILVFGQNIAAGSCLSGLTRGLQVKPGGRIINTPNSESTLCGVGLGAMMNGISSVFFMKQLDFLLLGIDQLVNTYNIARRKELQAAFTIFPVIVDSGYEGPQSSLNNLSDFCSVARIPGYTITTRAEAEKIIDRYLVAPGLRIIGVSQRLFKTEILDPEPDAVSADRALFTYGTGQDVTVVCFNLSLPYGLEFQRRLAEAKRSSSVFSVTAALPIPWDEIISAVQKTKRLVVINDSKSVNTSCQDFLSAVYRQTQAKKVVVLQRSSADYPFRPQHDQLEIDYESVIRELVS